MSAFTLRKSRVAVAPDSNERVATHDTVNSFAYDAYRASEATSASPEVISKLVDEQRMFMQRVKAEALNSSRSFQMMLVSGLTPSEMRSRMTTEFTALANFKLHVGEGVVCALLAGLGFAVLAVPPVKLLNNKSASSAFCAVTMGSIICNLACVGFSTLMISSVNLLTDEITAWYISNHGTTITTMNFQFFNVGFLLLLVSLLLFALYTYPPVVAYACSGLAVAAVVLVITVYHFVDKARFHKLKDVVRIILEQDAAKAEAAGAQGAAVSKAGAAGGSGGKGGRQRQATAGEEAAAGGAGGRSAAALQT